MSPIERKRLAAGLTQIELGQKIGASISTICKWERGLSVPSAKFYPRLAEVFGMTAEAVTHLFHPVETSPAPATSAA